MSDTFFTSSPHWGLYVLLYFFVGGIAGGCLFLAGLLHLVGDGADRPTIRAGYAAAFWGSILSGLLLTFDLTKPLRFWHMLVQSNTGGPMFKGWSPMSVGAWALVVIGAVATLGWLAGLGETRPAWRRFAWLGRGIAGGMIALLAIPLGLFLAGYTGVLVAVTNRPIWADSPWLGAVFLLSGVSAAVATLALWGQRRPDAGSSVHRLNWLDRWVLGLELVALAVFMVSLGPVLQAWVGWNGVALLVGVVGVGIVVPAWLHRSASRDADRLTARPPDRSLFLAPVLVLLGSFLLRLLVITSSARIHAFGSGVAGQ